MSQRYGSVTDETAYFLVTSFGRTATFWIASNLNRHGDIICSHGPAMPPVIPMEGSQPSQSDVLRMHRDLDDFYDMPLDRFFDAMERLGPAKAYGNAHAYGAQSVKGLLAGSSSGRRFTVVNVVRHPVTRIESLRNRFEYELTYNTYFRERIETYIEQTVTQELLQFVKSQCGVDLTFDTRLFLYALSLVPSHDKNDLQVPVLHVAMERVTRDPEAFCWMFNVLTHGKVGIDAEYLDSVFERGRLNVRGAERSAVRQYRQWDAWMREAFRYVMEEYDFQKMYGAMYYDFSFACNG